MAAKGRDSILEHGIRILRPRHNEIRKLKRLHSPSSHGFRVWPSTWLLIDFLRSRGVTENSRVLDLGCGWGAAGIYCAKNHGSLVTGVDIDAEVFPFLELHAAINGVEIDEVEGDFDDLPSKFLNNFDILIGADICFWDRLVGSLDSLFTRCMGAGIKKFVIADPGRTSFEDLAELFISRELGQTFDWTASHPFEVQGRILQIGH